MGNALGITGTMRETPRLPLLAIACVVYPQGGITSLSMKGCALGIRVQASRTTRDKGRTVTLKEYLSVATWVEGGDVALLAEALAGRLWDVIFFPRKPTVLYERLLELLPRCQWREFPQDWDDNTLVALANEMLRHVPVNTDAEFIGACEARPNVRRAFAGTLAGLRYMVGERRAMNAQPIQTKGAHLLGQATQNNGTLGIPIQPLTSYGEGEIGGIPYDHF